MKRKSLFLFGTIFSSLALIGGTLAAAWAVTDNANKIDVAITPGEISQTTATQSVVLSWGESELVNIQNLGNNETKGPYTINVLANTSTGAAYEGAFSATLSSTHTSGVRLIDNLTIEVYDKAKNENGANKLISIPDTTHPVTVNDGIASANQSTDVTVTNNTAKTLYVYVSLANLTEADYATVKTQTATLSVDWGKGSTTQEITSQTIYFDNQSNWENVYLYAWKQADGTNNAWPGVKMNLAKQGTNIYSVSLDTTKGFDKVIFNNGNSGTGNELPSVELSSGNPYYHYANSAYSWTTAPDLTAEVTYYLVGQHNEWTTSTAAKMTKLASSVTKGGHTYNYKIENVSIGAGGQLKVVSSTNIWYGENSHADDAPNMTIGEANHYDFYFNPDSAPYIFCEAHTA